MNTEIHWGRVGVILVAVAGIAGVFFLIGKKSNEESVASIPAPIIPITKQSVVPATKQQGTPASDVPTTAVYSNEKYGIKITFPPEVSRFEKIEASLFSKQTYNPFFAIEFGKNINDFYDEMGSKRGNMLSVQIFDRTKCNVSKLDSTEKAFCDYHKVDNSTGTWKMYDKTSQDPGFWLGNQNNLYYLNVSGTDQARNNNEKTFINKLKIELLGN
ncbi:MAG: hypothetical protein WAW00_02580 [Candidatus Moraniibacteriota bacterium]